MKHLRTLRFLALAALGLGAVGTVQRPALAQTDAAASQAQSAERVESLIEQGIALRRAGSDAQALRVFQQAEQLGPDSVRLQVHLAATHQALGAWEAADRYLSKALERPTDPYIVKHQETLAAARRSIDAHIGTLEVLGEPAGAEVRVNGRLLGTLPLERPARLAAGIYALEVTLPRHFPVTRSVALAGGLHARESVTLAPRTDAASLAPALGASATDEAPRSDGERAWLSWTLAGASAAAAVTSVFLWTEREKYAERWNDNARCQGGGQTRGALCGDLLDKGERAETWMLISGGASVAFAAGAVLNHLLSPEPAAAGARDALACGVGPGSVACAGRF